METIEKKPLRNYTIYLIKKDRSELNQIINFSNVEDDYQIRKGSNIIGNLYLKKSVFQLPRWAEIFKGYIDDNKIGKGGNPSALLLIKIQDRVFAVTFGFGRYLLVQDCWEERFGLKAALNIIHENSIKSLDKKTFDSISILTREQASKEIKEDFGLDIEKDLLSAVVGFPMDKAIGERASVMDSFKTAVRAELDLIKDLCWKIYEKSEDSTYKEKYPWVDHLSEVKNKDLIKKLEDEIVKYVKEEKFDKCWTCIPEIINWNEVEGFKYGLGPRSLMHYDIHLPEFLKEKLNDEEITIDKLKNRFVYAVTEDHIKKYEWSIYKCL